MFRKLQLQHVGMSDTNRQNNPVDNVICEVPRWSLIKATLNNLEYESFLEKYQKEKDAIMIDCRRPDEFDFLHLEEAINIDYLSYDLADLLEKLDREKVYYVYCRSGRRSLRMCKLMENCGISQVYNMEEGILHLL